jgi:hypothetical protein
MIEPSLSNLYLFYITAKRTGTFDTTLAFKKRAVAPVFTGALNYQLDTNLIGQLRYKTTMNLIKSSLSTALIYERENFNINIRFQMSIKNTFVSLAMSKKFTSNNIKLNSSIKYGYMGATLTYGVEKQVTQFSKVNAKMIINSFTGVLLNLE